MTTLIEVYLAQKNYIDFSSILTAEFEGASVRCHIPFKKKFANIYTSDSSDENIERIKEFVKNYYKHNHNIDVSFRV